MRLSLVSPNSITGTTLTDRLLHPGRYTLNKCTLSGYPKADLSDYLGFITLYLIAGGGHADECMCVA